MNLDPRYRVNHHIASLGWLWFGYSTVCPILLGQMVVWQNGLISWVSWVEHQNQTQSNEVMVYPVLFFESGPMSRLFSDFSCVCVCVCVCIDSLPVRYYPIPLGCGLNKFNFSCLSFYHNFPEYISVSIPAKLLKTVYYRIYWTCLGEIS